MLHCIIVMLWAKFHKTFWERQHPGPAEIRKCKLWLRVAISNSHRVQSYSRDKMDWTMQSWKLSYSRQKSVDIGLKFPLYIDFGRSIQILWVVVKFEKRFWKQWLISVLSVCSYFPEKNRYSPTRWEKSHFHCSLGQITLFPNKFTFFMYSMNQHTHSVWANGLDIYQTV